jgi:hypothetical protein
MYPHTVQLQNMPWGLALGFSALAKISIANVLGSEGGSLAKPRTQRSRYVMTVVSALISFTILIIYLAVYTPGTVYHEVASWPGRYGLLGDFWALPVVLTLLVPLWVAIDAFHIYRHPSQHAKRVRWGARSKRGYYLTEDVRVGRLAVVLRGRRHNGPFEYQPGRPIPPTNAEDFGSPMSILR